MYVCGCIHVYMDFLKYRLLLWRPASQGLPLGARGLWPCYSPRCITAPGPWYSLSLPASLGLPLSRGCYSWAGEECVQSLKTQRIVFTDAPLFLF